ncbi:hypothetical protein VNI00_009892 [Paramarasmius palmivorus]|uniref:Zn(2)-C6 fungal-type domain-containing protein n=1 Tax=Paramarasmius palmivorus TaxID=297713 RepID=A0AAW0CNS0_9AGAR
MSSEQSKKRSVRTHIKSRLGCFTCKQRRVKCDEVHPICGNCERRKTECFWIDRIRQASISTHSSPATPATPSQSPPQAADEPEWQYQWLAPSPNLTSISSSPAPLDTSSLKLMHHYSLVTSTTLKRDHSLLFTHQFVIPSVAFREQAVMHALLAVSSIHLHTLYQPLGLADQDYFSLAQYHKNLALTHDLTLDTNVASSADTHLLTRNFLTVYKLAESLAASDSRPAVFSLIETLRHALLHKDHLFRDEQLKPLNWPFRGISIVPSEAEEDIWLAQAALTATSSPPRRFPRFLTQIHLPLLSYPDPEEVLDQEISDTYKEAIFMLRDSWYICQRPGVELAGAVSWILRVTDRFRELLVVERRQRALVVLYFYCAMLGQLDPCQCWWAGREQDYRAWLGMMLDAKWMECIVLERS